MSSIRHTDEILTQTGTPVPEGPPTRLIDVHIYDLPAAETELPGVESTILPDDTQDEEASQDEAAPPPRQPWRRGLVLPVVFLACCLLIAGITVVVALLPSWAPSATVTLVPITKTISSTGTIIVVTAPPSAQHDQIAGRRLSSITMSQAQTVPTTGTAHQDAHAAQGVITFYNAATGAQTIPAGTLLTGADGVQVVTEQDAIIPAASYPTFGQATVSAHAVVAGPQGNIHAGDIYGSCCRLNISAVSHAFSGGQAARTYQTATQQDITSAASTLTTSIDQSIQAALQTQVRANETLITPLPCQPTVTADHEPGAEAAQVRVTESETCTGEVYNANDYHALVTQFVISQATRQLGAGYSQVGDVQASTMHVSTTQQSAGTIAFVVKATGQWMYQFQPSQLQHLAALIAGQSKAQATQRLLGAPGVQSVSITTTHTERLPTDLNQIHLLLLQDV